MSTDLPPVDATDGPAQESERRSWGDVAVEIAGRIARLADSRLGDLAELRRMEPDEPDAAVFWRLMAEYDLFGNPDVERKWALILHGIALMTPRNRAGGGTSTAHDGYNPVGRALFLGSESRRESGHYSETRLNRLLTARGPMIRILLARMFRMLTSDGVTFNWREMAQFILNEGYDEEATEWARRRIARDYYTAERRSLQTSND